MRLFNCSVTISSLYITGLDTYSKLSLSEVFETSLFDAIDTDSMLLDYNKNTVTFNISFEQIEDRASFIKNISLILENYNYEYSYSIGDLNYA